MIADGDTRVETAPAEPDARYRWYVLVVLMLIYTVHYLDRSVINAVLEPIRKEFQLSDAQLGLLAGPIYAVGFALAGIPIGMLVDRLSRKRLLAGLLIGWSGLTLLSGFANSFVALLFARFAVGAAEAGGSPTALSLVSDYFPPRRRSTATGVFFLSVTLGVLAGYSVSGLVAHQYGWRAAFFVAGAPGLMLALVLLATVREPLRGRFDAPVPAAAQPSLRRTFGTLFGRKPLFATLAGILVSASVISGFLAFAISLLVRRHGLDLGSASIAVGLFSGISAGVGSLVWGALGDRLGRRGAHLPSRMIALTCILSVACGAIGVLAPVTAVALAGFVGFGFFSASFMGSGYALLLNLSPSDIRGSCTATSQVLINLIGVGLGPLLVGTLSTMIGRASGSDGLGPAMLCAVSLNLLAAGCHVVAARHIAAESRAVPPGGAAAPVSPAVQASGG